MVGLKGLLSCKIFKCSVVLLHGTFHANIQSLIVEVKCPKLEVISGYVDAAGRGFSTATPLVRYVWPYVFHKGVRSNATHGSLCLATAVKSINHLSRTFIHKTG